MRDSDRFGVVFRFVVEIHRDRIRIGDDFHRRSVAEKPPAFLNDVRSVDDAERVRYRMVVDDDRKTFGRHLANFALDRSDSWRVARGERFVKHENFRLANQRARKF